MDHHIWRGGGETHKVQIVVHMDVNGAAGLGNNAVGTPFAKALILSGFSSGTSVMTPGDGSDGTIARDEAALIEIGTRLEFIEDFTLPSGWSGMNQTEKQDAVRTWRLGVVAKKTDDIVAALNFFGLSFN